MTLDDFNKFKDMISTKYGKLHLAPYTTDDPNDPQLENRINTLIHVVYDALVVEPSVFAGLQPPIFNKRFAEMCSLITLVPTGTLMKSVAECITLTGLVWDVLAYHAEQSKGTMKPLGQDQIADLTSMKSVNTASLFSDPVTTVTSTWVLTYAIRVMYQRHSLSARLPPHDILNHVVMDFFNDIKTHHIDSPPALRQGDDIDAMTRYLVRSNRTSQQVFRSTQDTPVEKTMIRTNTSQLINAVTQVSVLDNHPPPSSMAAFIKHRTTKTALYAKAPPYKIDYNKPLTIQAFRSQSHDSQGKALTAFRETMREATAFFSDMTDTLQPLW